VTSTGAPETIPAATASPSALCLVSEASASAAASEARTSLEVGSEVLFAAACWADALALALVDELLEDDEDWNRRPPMRTVAVVVRRSEC
jgi:hypothetical protein